MAKQLDHNEVDDIENELLNAESLLESIGRKVCDVEGGLDIWNGISESVRQVQNVIRNTWRMRPS